METCHTENGYQDRMSVAIGLTAALAARHSGAEVAVCEKAGYSTGIS